VARLLADGFQAGFGQRFIVENRIGAGGTIAAKAAARSPADGSTLFMGILSTQVVLPIVRRVPYDPERAFAPVGLVSTRRWCSSSTRPCPSVRCKTSSPCPARGAAP
jgi:tripartite-type tricarboxylate transporter receptor subunit TctC